MNPNEKNALRLDGDEQVFFDQQLALVKARTYDVQHKALKALTLLPVSVDQDPGATHVIWRSYDQVGMAKIIADYANDFPRADIAGVEHSSPVKDLGMSYGYSIKEIRRAQKAGVALDMKRAEAARRAIFLQNGRERFQNVSHHELLCALADVIRAKSAEGAENIVA